MKKDISVLETLATFDSLPGCARVRLPVVMSLFGVSSTTVWRNVKAGLIPKPDKLSSRATTWNVGELRKALDAHSDC